MNRLMETISYKNSSTIQRKSFETNDSEAFAIIDVWMAFKTASLSSHRTAPKDVSKASGTTVASRKILWSISGGSIVKHSTDVWDLELEHLRGVGKQSQTWLDLRLHPLTLVTSHWHVLPIFSCSSPSRSLQCVMEVALNVEIFFHPPHDCGG